MVTMIVHTLIYSFSPEMGDDEREAFFEEVAGIMLNEGQAQHVSHARHLRVPGDDHAPVFAASATAEVHFADLDALIQTSALTSMQDFVARWQKRRPYRAVWVNYEAPDGDSHSSAVV
jgi:hypothetical protein